MKRIAMFAAAAVIALGAGTVSASAACNRDADTETALGAGSGALVGGLASHSIVGAVVGGVAGGVIGNSIGHSNNREDCRRAAARRSPVLLPGSRRPPSLLLSLGRDSLNQKAPDFRPGLFLFSEPACRPSRPRLSKSLKQGCRPLGCPPPGAKR